MYSIVKGTRRHRYIRFHVVYAEPHDPITAPELIQTIRRHTRDRFSREARDMGLWIVHFDGTSGIIKCCSCEKENTKQLLESLKMIGSRPVSITTLGTSGTIRGLTD